MPSATAVTDMTGEDSDEDCAGEDDMDEYDHDEDRMPMFKARTISHLCPFLLLRLVFQVIPSIPFVPPFPLHNRSSYSGH